jgi:hypothetical protein
MGFMDKVKDLLHRHDDKVDQAIGKAGEVAKGRFAGHDEKIDRAVGKAREMTGEGDTTQAPPPQEPPPPEEAPPPEDTPPRK